LIKEVGESDSSLEKIGDHDSTSIKDWRVPSYFGKMKWIYFHPPSTAELSGRAFPIGGFSGQSSY
jgi:hypothetical protein